MCKRLGKLEKAWGNDTKPDIFAGVQQDGTYACHYSARRNSKIFRSREKIIATRKDTFQWLRSLADFNVSLIIDGVMAESPEERSLDSEKLCEKACEEYPSTCGNFGKWKRHTLILRSASAGGEKFPFAQKGCLDVQKIYNKAPFDTRSFLGAKDNDWKFPQDLWWIYANYRHLYFCNF
jgi:hypothetical protein